VRDLSVEHSAGPSFDEAVLAAWLAAARVRPESAPGWMAALVEGAATVRASDLSQNNPPATVIGPRQAAVLILLGHDVAAGPDVLLQQRADGLRDHPGQVSFPGGSWEHGDASPVETAIREAVEETGLDPSGVDPVAVLPRLLIPPSGFQVTAVVAHWRHPSAVAAIDHTENAAVMRIPLAQLADPRNRLTVTNGAGWVGPAFALAGMVIWGYTGAVLDAMLRMGGWELAWTHGPAQDLDHVWASVRDS
jgi:8-oxo-dGTP pyrophosphatase MutT (NUDIX family)